MEDIIVCRCEGVRLSEVIKAIEDDANAVPGIKKRVRPGMGFCQGRVCQPIIAKLLEQSIDEVVYQRAQAPVRPVLLADLIKQEEEKG